MEDNKSMTVKKTVKSGITFGSALAMVISYTTWKSVGWAIFHGLLSWVYVIYFLNSLMEKAKISHALYHIVSVYFLEVCQATWHL